MSIKETLEGIGFELVIGAYGKRTARMNYEGSAYVCEFLIMEGFWTLVFLKDGDMVNSRVMGVVLESEKVLAQLVALDFMPAVVYNRTRKIDTLLA